MGTTQKPLVIDNPSQKLLDFVRNMEKRKEERNFDQKEISIFQRK